MIEYWTTEGSKITDNFNTVPWRELHREDGPSYIGYNKSNKLSEEYYYINGKRHRENGPAYIIYIDNIINTIIYYNNDLYHRIDGPAVILHYDDRESKEEYYLFGKEFPYEEWKFIVNNNMGNIKPRHWSRDFKIMYKLKFK